MSGIRTRRHQYDAPMPSKRKRKGKAKEDSLPLPFRKRYEECWLHILEYLPIVDTVRFLFWDDELFLPELAPFVNTYLQLGTVRIGPECLRDHPVTDEVGSSFYDHIFENARSIHICQTDDEYLLNRLDKRSLCVISFYGVDFAHTTAKLTAHTAIINACCNLYNVSIDCDRGRLRMINCSDSEIDSFYNYQYLTYSGQTFVLHPHLSASPVREMSIDVQKYVLSSNVHLKSLTHLCLAGEEHYQGEQANVRLPELRELRLRRAERETTWKPIEERIADWGCAKVLQKLELSHPPRHLDFLKVFPALEELTIGNWEYDRVPFPYQRLSVKRPLLKIKYLNASYQLKSPSDVRLTDLPDRIIMKVMRELLASPAPKTLKNMMKVHERFRVLGTIVQNQRRDGWLCVSKASSCNFFLDHNHIRLREMSPNVTHLSVKSDDELRIHQTIACFKHLLGLHINATKIKLSDVDAIQHYPRTIRHLIIDWGVHVEEDFAAALVQHLHPNLERVDAPGTVLRRCRGIRHLTLSIATMHEDLQELWTNNPAIETLVLLDRPKERVVNGIPMDVNFNAIGELKELKTLRTNFVKEDWWPQLETVEEVEILSGTWLYVCPLLEIIGDRLKKLTIHTLHQYQDAAYVLPAIARFAPTLELLRIHAEEFDGALADFAMSLPNLRTLGYDYNCLESLAVLLEDHPELVNIEIWQYDANCELVILQEIVRRAREVSNKDIQLRTTVESEKMGQLWQLELKWSHEEEDEGR